MRGTRISYGRQGDYEDLIAILLRIQGEMRGMIYDMDNDTLAHLMPRISNVIRAAETGKGIVIELRDGEYAANGRENS